MILFACEVAAAIWGFMNRDTVSDRDCFHPRFSFFGGLFFFFSTIFHPQISKELINFYDSAYIKAVDVSGSPSKDAAIKVLDVFHTTVRYEVEPSSLFSSSLFLNNLSGPLIFHLLAGLLR